MWAGTGDEAGLRACPRICGLLEYFARDIGVTTQHRTALLLPNELSVKVAVESVMYAAPPWFSSRGPCKLGKDEWVIICCLGYCNDK